MPQFVLEGRDEPEFKDLGSFTQGYIEAMFFTENEPGTSRDDRYMYTGEVDPEWESRVAEGQQKDIPGDYGFCDLAPETLTEIIRRCEEFQSFGKAGELLAQAYDLSAEGLAYTPERAGHDFWFTSEGHGVGFWDRGLGEVGDALSKACDRRESYVYIGDDGKVRIA